MLQFGVDALHIAYRIEPHSRLLPTLDALLPEHRTRAGYDLGGVRFEVVRVRERFALRNADCAIVVGRDRGSFTMVFEARAMLLRRKGLEETIHLGRSLVEDLAVAPAKDERVRRADLFMDVCGANFVPDDMAHFVSRARKQAEFHVPEKVYHAKDQGEVRVTGFWFSPGNPIQVRLYDKLEELQVVAGKDSSKLRTELSTYRGAGWDGQAPVWRLEAQLRGNALKRRSIVRPQNLLARLWDVWDYCFASDTPWLRLVLPESRTRRERSTVDPRWALFTENPFGQSGEVVKPEPGNLGGISPEQVMGDLWSFLASRGFLQPLDPKTPRDDMLLGDLLEVGNLLINLLKKSDGSLLTDRAAVIGKYSTIDDGEYFRSNFEDLPEEEE